MSSFQDLGIFVHNNPERKASRCYAHAAFGWQDKERENVRISFGLLPQVYCERKPQNLFLKTSCVLSVLIYDHDNQGLDKGLVDQEVVRSHIVPGNLLFTQPSSR